MNSAIIQFDHLSSALSSLKPHTTCQFEAIQSLLPNCDIALDSHVRTTFAVKLSRCEFQHANVDYPRSCDAEPFTNCAAELEQRPQWWTTYSGNYRLVNQLCHEHREHYAAQNWVEFHEHAASLHRQMVLHLDEAVQSLDLSIVSRNDTEAGLAKLTNSLDSILHSNARLAQSVDQTLVRLCNVEQSVDAITDRINDNVVMLDNLLLSIETQLNKVLAQTRAASVQLEINNATAHKIEKHHRSIERAMRISAKHAYNLSATLQTAQQQAVRRRAQLEQHMQSYQHSISTALVVVIIGAALYAASIVLESLSWVGNALRII